MEPGRSIFVTPNFVTPNFVTPNDAFFIAAQGSQSLQPRRASTLPNPGGPAPFPLHVNQPGSPQFTNRFAVAFPARFADNYAERPCAPQPHRKDVAGHCV